MLANDKLSVYASYRATTKVLLCALGLWPMEKPCFLYRFLPYLCIFTSAVASFAILGFIFRNITKVAVVVRGMSIGTSLVSGLIKIVCILVHHKRATELHSILDKSFRSALAESHLSNLVLAGVRTVRRLCWILIPTVFLVIGVYIATPIMSITHQKRHSIDPVKYSLIYPGVYPYFIPNGIVYEIHFVIEFLASLTIFCVTCGVDALFAYYVFQMIGQLRIMAYRLTHIDARDRIETVIKECVQKYEVLLRCRDSMQKIFGPIIVWMMGTNAIVLCALMFQVSQQSKHLSVFRWVLVVSYLILKVTQTYIYSWSGSCLIAQSDKYREAIYKSDWLSNKSAMSSIIIMLSQRPLHLKACDFFIVSVDMFVMILNTTVSYYFLLRTIEQKS